MRRLESSHSSYFKPKSIEVQTSLYPQVFRPPGDCYIENIVSENRLNTIPLKNQASIIEKNHFPSNIRIQIGFDKPISYSNLNQRRLIMTLKKNLRQQHNLLSDKSKSKNQLEQERAQLEEHLLENLRQSLLTNHVWKKWIIHSSTRDSELQIPQESKSEPSIGTCDSLTHKNVEPSVKILYQQPNILNLRKAACESREGSLQLQKFIRSNSIAEIRWLINLTASDLNFMMFSRNGTYLVQRLIEVDDVFSQTVVEFSLPRIKELIMNEYSCRALQSLCTKSSWFRKYIFTIFKSNQIPFHSIIPVFLASSAMSATTHQERFSFFLKMVKSGTLSFDGKYVKKLFIAFAESCLQSDAFELFAFLTSQKLLNEFLDNKSMSHIILHLVLRNVDGAFELIQELLLVNPVEVFQRRFFSFFMLKLIREGSQVFLGKFLSLFLHSRLRDNLLGHADPAIGAFYMYCLIQIRVLIRTHPELANIDKNIQATKHQWFKVLSN